MTGIRSSLQAGADAPLQVRVGIATGVTVVGGLIGQGASQEQAVANRAFYGDCRWSEASE